MISQKLKNLRLLRASSVGDYMVQASFQQNQEAKHSFQQAQNAQHAQQFSDLASELAMRATSQPADQQSWKMHESLRKSMEIK